MKPLFSALAAALPLLPLSTSAAADPVVGSEADGAERGAAERVAGAGAFLGWTEQARTDTHRGVLGVHAGHATLRGWSRSGAAELVLLSPAERGRAPRTGRDVGLALRAGGFSRGDEDGFHGELGVKAQLVFADDAGFDLAASVSYRDEGFNLRPALVPQLLVSTELGRLLLVGNLRYGHGLADDERFGALQVAALAEVTPSLRVGLDSKLELDLELDEDEPDGEPQVLFQAGPAATFAVGNVALSAQGGLSVLQLRFEEARTGGVVLAGVGGAF